MTFWTVKKTEWMSEGRVEVKKPEPGTVCYIEKRGHPFNKCYCRVTEGGILIFLTDDHEEALEML